MDPKVKQNSWRGFESLEYLFVFGASGSSVLFNLHSPDPTPSSPLGVPFPGVTYAGEGNANWVGHLINKYTRSSPLVYDHAVGGVKVDGVLEQVQEGFLKRPGLNNAEVPWTAANSLFVTTIGDVKDTLKQLFSTQDIIYEAGARNFLFFNISPLPKLREDGLRDSKGRRRFKEKAEVWNALLPNHIRRFGKKHRDMTVFLFDEHALLSKIILDPTQYGFSANAGRMQDNETFLDHVHPTSAVHRILARELASFLAGEDIGDDQPEKYKTMVTLTSELW